MSTAPGSSGVVVLRPGEVEDPDDTCISVLVLGPEGDVGPGVVDLVVAPEGSPAAEHREVVGVPDVDAAIDTIRRRVAERPLAAGALAN